MDTKGTEATVATGEVVRPWRPQRALVAVFVVLIVAGCFLALRANVRVHNDHSADCRLVLSTDDLFHLPERTKRQVTSQLARWKACDDELVVIKRARTALRWDYALIGVMIVALALAVWRVRKRRRWRLAGDVAAAFGVAYVVCDLLENVWLHKVLNSRIGDPDLHAGLRWVSAIKLGAFGAAAPVVVIAFFLAVGGEEPYVGRVPRGRHAVRRFWRRWTRRLLESDVHHAILPEPAPEPATAGALGICCSGGGIRSASFNLGALQALDEPEQSEVERAQWLSAVSGGSYIAAAWVTGRMKEPDAWSRRSFEEDHLRRHASYLAPGLSGKLWALTRFLLGFGVNLGIITLALLVVFLPTGWGVARMKHTRPIKGGVIETPVGGCLTLDDGREATVVPGGRMRLIDVRTVRVEPGTAVIHHWPSDGAVPAKVTCPATKSLTPGDGQLASTPNLVIASGSVVELARGWPVRVDASGARACIQASSPKPGTSVTCLSSKAAVLASSSTGQLEAEPQALLALNGRAIVLKKFVRNTEGNEEPEYRLQRACGRHACTELRRFVGFRWLTFSVAALAMLMGIALVSVPMSTRQMSRVVERWARRLTWVALAAVVVFYLFPRLVVWAEQGKWLLDDKIPQTSGAGIGVILLTLLAQINSFTAGSATPLKKAAALTKRLGPRVRAVLVRFAGAVVGPLLIVIGAVAIASFAAERRFEPDQLTLWLFALGPLVVLGSGADLNEWSLHPFYREALRFGFAVDRPTGPPKAASQQVVPLPALKASTPELLICAAANLGDDRITPPGRPVTSWVFSRSTMGSDAIARATGDSATIPTEELQDDDRWRPLVETWTTVAVSGAAVAPAMGKMTIPERSLLALGNLRLGVWYPNPRYWCAPAASKDDTSGRIDRSWYEMHHPRPWYLVKEAFGIHKLHDPWIYLTDGGHYENLGLVELLRRGARETYCFDAAGDKADTFGTMSDAMRLAREELGVEIDIRPGPAMKPDENGISHMGVWAGVVRYPTGEEGWIVIAKLSVPDTAPFDVIDLARTLPSFPNHPTADQLYTDQKFEAYRALGHHLGSQALELAGLIRKNRRARQPMNKAVDGAIKTLCEVRPIDPCGPASES